MSARGAAIRATPTARSTCKDEEAEAHRVHARKRRSGESATEERREKDSLPEFEISEQPERAGHLRSTRRDPRLSVGRRARLGCEAVDRAQLRHRVRLHRGHSGPAAGRRRPGPPAPRDPESEDPQDGLGRRVVCRDHEAKPPAPAPRRGRRAGRAAPGRRNLRPPRKTSRATCAGAHRLLEGRQAGRRHGASRRFQGPLDRRRRSGDGQDPRHRRTPRRRVDPRGRAAGPVRRERHGLDARRPHASGSSPSATAGCTSTSWTSRCRVRSRPSSRRGSSSCRRPSCRRDKTKFYLTSTEVHPGERHIYEMPIAGGARTKLTTHDGIARSVEVSPDGTMIADSSTRTSPRRPEVFLMPNNAGREASR